MDLIRKNCTCNRDGSQQTENEVKRTVKEAEWEEKIKRDRRTKK
jgi:hypothetical protein